MCIWYRYNIRIRYNNFGFIFVNFLFFKLGFIKNLYVCDTWYKHKLTPPIKEIHSFIIDTESCRGIYIVLSFYLKKTRLEKGKYSWNLRTGEILRSETKECMKARSEPQGIGHSDPTSHRYLPIWPGEIFLPFSPHLGWPSTRNDLQGDCEWGWRWREGKEWGEMRGERGIQRGRRRSRHSPLPHPLTLSLSLSLPPLSLVILSIIITFYVFSPRIWVFVQRRIIPL